jgi:hypothetical protein
MRKLSIFANKYRTHLPVLRMPRWTTHPHHQALLDHRIQVAVQQHPETSAFRDNMTNSILQLLFQIMLLIHPQDQVLLWPVRRGKFELYDNSGIMLQARRKVYEESRGRVTSTVRAYQVALPLLPVEGRVRPQTCSHRRRRG